MSFGIIRIQKFKAQAVRGIQSHDKRERESRSNPDIDKGRSDLNYDLVECSDFKEAIKERLDTLENQTVRKNAVHMVQFLITSDHDFFKDIPAARQREFFEQSLAFIADRYGKENILSATVHMDEKTPHMHVNLTPIRGHKLSAKAIFDRNELRNLHTDFHHSVGQPWGLERGESGQEKRQHLDTAAFKLAARKKELDREEERLHEQAVAAEKALQDMALPKVSFLSGKKPLQEHIEVLQGALANKHLIEKENIELRTKVDELTSNVSLLESSVSVLESKRLELYKTNDYLRKEVGVRDDFLEDNPDIKDAFWTHRKAKAKEVSKQKSEIVNQKSVEDWKKELIGDDPPPKRQQPKQPTPVPEVPKEQDVPAVDDHALTLDAEERQRVKHGFTKALKQTPGTMGKHMDQCKELMAQYDVLEGAEVKKAFVAEQMKVIQGQQLVRGRG